MQVEVLLSEGILVVPTQLGLCMEFVTRIKVNGEGRPGQHAFLIPSPLLSTIKTHTTEPK